jgi:hypothetical protein
MSEYDEKNIVAIIGKKRYSVAESTLLATVWVSLAIESEKPTTTLYRTAKGAYFKVLLWSNDPEVKPITQEQAIRLYERATETHVEYSAAFPDVQIEDA